MADAEAAVSGNANEGGARDAPGADGDAEAMQQEEPEQQLEGDLDQPADQQQQQQQQADDNQQVMEVDVAEHPSDGQLMQQQQQQLGEEEEEEQQQQQQQEEPDQTTVWAGKLLGVMQSRPPPDRKPLSLDQVQQWMADQQVRGFSSLQLQHHQLQQWQRNPPAMEA
jgi:hypothetical protein